MSMDLLIVFSKGRGWLSDVITWHLKGPASHISWAVTMESIRFAVGSDQRGGLYFQTMDLFKGHNDLLMVVMPQASLDNYFRRFLIKHTGCDYDFWSAGASGVKHRYPLIWRLFGKEITDWADESKLMCAEAITEVLQYDPENFKSVSKLNPAVTSVTDLFNIMANPDHSDQFRVLWMADKLKKAELRA